MKKFSCIVFVLYFLTVLYLCFGRISVDEELPRFLWGIPIDKCAHFGMFLPFPIFCTLAFSRKKPWRVLSFSLIAGIAVATSIELLQSFLTDYRTTDIWDLVANMAAIAAGGLLTAVFLMLRSR